MKPSGTLLTFLLFLSARLAMPAYAQQISYLLPDIGAPGMNTYVEVIGPHAATGNFGPDGVYANNPGDRVRLVCARPGDTATVVIGPLVVSWNGRMIATQVFVREAAAPNSTRWDRLRGEFRIPLKVVVDGLVSNADTFYVVQPVQHLTVGNNNSLGDPAMAARSRRGAMIFDSLTLGPGNVLVDNRDCDPATDGNQGMLPLVVISRGPVNATGGGIIRIDANGKLAAPGGGGGGGNYCDVSGGGANGGDGFTGGGRGGQNKSGVPFASDIWRQPGTGSGARIGSTGGSLNGIPGGTSDAYEAAGGGTGHPFGMAGEGCIDGNSCNPQGGYGGGSGWTQNSPGGAGGFATAGAHPGVGGGKVHGNTALVPLAGGSGGASGNPQGLSVCSGDGGGGGGAVAVYGRSIADFAVNAMGAAGGDGNGRSDGGSGSGGGIILGAKTRLAPGTLGVDGGGAFQPGGEGRIRIDGIPEQPIPAGASRGMGPTTDTTHRVPRTFTLTGTGDGHAVTLWLKEGPDPWRTVAIVAGYSGNAWSQTLTLNGREAESWLVAMQDVPNPASGQFDAEPAAVLSQAAANVLRFTLAPRTEAVDRVVFDTLACATSADTVIFVKNTGAGPLVIDSVTITAPAFSLIAPTIPATVPPGDSLPFVIRFGPPAGAYGPYSGVLRIMSNDTARARNPFVIQLEAWYDHVLLAALSPALAFDTLFSCTGASATKTATIRNTGTLPLRILGRCASGAAFGITTPGAFPVTLAPSATLDFVVRFSPPSPGAFSDTLIIDGDALSCTTGLRIPITGRYETVSHTEPADIVFTPLFCPEEIADTTFAITNTGSTALILRNPVITGTGMSVTGPAFPLTIPAGGTATIGLRFAPADPVAAGGTLTIPYEPCDGNITIALSGRRDTVYWVQNFISFDIVHPNKFPAFHDTPIKNRNPVPIVITSVSFSGDPVFSLVTPLPITVQPGETVQLVIRFDDPGVDGEYYGDMNVVNSPSCVIITSHFRGIRSGVAATIQPGAVSGRVGETVWIPIYLRSQINLSLAGASGIATTLRYATSVLHPLFTENAVVDKGESYIQLSLPFSAIQGDVMTVLPFLVTLGSQDTTTLWLENSTGIGGYVDVKELPGFFTVSNICREGGTRLFATDGKLGLRQNNPNPFNAQTRIEFETIEDGSVRLWVGDRLGRTVATLVDGDLPRGMHSVQFDAGRLPSGMYTYVLQTATGIIVRSMTVVK